MQVKEKATMALEIPKGVINKPQCLLPFNLDGQLGILIVNAGSHDLLFYNPRDSSCTILAGGSQPGHRDGPMQEALFTGPCAAVFNRCTNRLYVADTGNHCIRVLSMSRRQVTTLTGSPGLSGYRDGMTPLFNQPSGLVLTPCGNLLVCDRGNDAIRFISTTNGETITVAGKPRSALASTQPGIYAFTNSLTNAGLCTRSQRRGNYLTVELLKPLCIISYSRGGYLLADSSGVLYHMDQALETLTQLNGNPIEEGGTLMTARFGMPRALLETERGTFICDSTENKVWLLTDCPPFPPQKKLTGVNVDKELPPLQTLVRPSSAPPNSTTQVSRVAPSLNKSTFNLQSSSPSLVPSNPSIISDPHSSHESFLEDLNLIPVTTPDTQSGIEAETFTFTRLLYEPYQENTINLKLFNALLQTFCAHLSDSTMDGTSTYAEQFSGVRATITCATPKAQDASGRTFGVPFGSRRAVPSRLSISNVAAQPNQDELPLKHSIALILVLSSRTYDMSEPLFAEYGRLLARQLRSFNPIIYSLAITREVEEPLLNTSLQGILKALAMSSNGLVYAADVTTTDGLKAEYCVATAKGLQRVIILEPKTTNIILNVSFAFLVDSVFERCFSTVEARIYASQMSISYGPGLGPASPSMKPGSEVFGSSTGSTLRKISNYSQTMDDKVAQLASTSVMDATNPCLSESELVSSLELDSREEESFPAVRKPILVAKILTKDFSPAISGLYNYHPNHGVCEFRISLPITLRDGADGLVKRLSTKAFEQKYGTHFSESACFEIVLSVTMVGYLEAKGERLDTIELGDHLSVTIPLVVGKNLAVYDAIVEKVQDQLRGSHLPRNVRTISGCVILDVAQPKGRIATHREQLRERLAGLLS
ncbi:NHL repeat-containing protein [Giardia muris]|uniref:NHL repeat-containing protein n=1 Tax=Giardia muris TaxID=5742 RepID=A0A4Z1SLB3_GIAMU|nr:NHL repeat-containing protein [Giardia muris]|eukprot:TNJ26290.1 NHL repeat-containing protein [Giardia muris]